MTAVPESLSADQVNRKDRFTYYDEHARTRTHIYTHTHKEKKRKEEGGGGGGRREKKKKKKERRKKREVLARFELATFCV